MTPYLVTACTSEIAPFCSELLDNKTEYAARHGFELVVIRENWFPDLQPAYMKLVGIQAALQRTDLVLWVDMDIAITDMTKSVVAMLPEDKAFAALEQSPDYFCTGLMLVRTAMANVLANVWQRVGADTPENNNKHPWEQRHCNDEVAAHGFDGWHRWSLDDVGAFWEEGWWSGRPWKEGDFSVHLGGAEWSRRRQVYLDKYVKAVRR